MNHKKRDFNLIFTNRWFYTGFIYCGFDGDKSKLKEMTNDGWQIVSFNSQNFQTQKEMESLFHAMAIYTFLKDTNNLKITISY